MVATPPGVTELQAGGRWWDVSAAVKVVRFPNWIFFLKWGSPKIIHFHWIFLDNHKTFWETPNFRKPLNYPCNDVFFRQLQILIPKFALLNLGVSILVPRNHNWRFLNPGLTVGIPGFHVGQFWAPRSLAHPGNSWLVVWNIVYFPIYWE